MTFTLNSTHLNALQPSAGGHCWVAYSGGLDSSVLLHWLARHCPQLALRAVHVNHGLSVNADAWQSLCEQQCRALGISLKVVTVQLDSAAGNLEAHARAARYKAFRQVLGIGDTLALAHHLDDQAETLLYRLLRGAGARGLGAMAHERRLGAARLVRPLLDVSRAELEQYASAHGLAWVNDESNRDVRFDRNYLRQRVIPVLRERWPAAANSLADSATLSRGNDQLLAEYAAEDLARLAERAVPMGFCLPADALAAMSVPRRYNLLRYWLEQRFLQLPSRNALAEIDTQLLGAAAVGHAKVAVGGVSLQRFQQALYALSASQQWQPNQGPAGHIEPSITWLDITQALALPGGDHLVLQPATGLGIAQRWLQGELEIRWRRGGERCRPAGRGHSQALKKLLQEYQVPPWLRARVPLLYIDGELVAVGHYWVCQGFTAAVGEPSWACCWQWPDVQGS
ncbi:tRNA lysidine(34) synthetase TilS [Gilvimarinus polysaccharolyticus]|uniref:tRNA lysidine(34) synthetase TilS n=1 Tax=Gilvimarinus polysaccharolyticus TaxID=863921 RepID=UPI0006733B1C|nr:tRNA lysidine(34) synthetase TilS [Gilvimarinus polysaccharolyticus]